MYKITTFRIATICWLHGFFIFLSIDKDHKGRQCSTTKYPQKYSCILSNLSMNVRLWRGKNGKKRTKVSSFPAKECQYEVFNIRPQLPLHVLEILYKI